jgi:undecaprenyl-diphosphatase
MLTELYAFDRALFVAINSLTANQAVDAFFQSVTNLGSVFLLGVMALAMFIRGHKKQGVALLMVLAATSLSVMVLKLFILRPRPFEEIATAKVLDIEFDSGFPSGHSANSFAAAGMLGRYYGKLKYVFYAFAALIAFSRIYVGVHYPSDVIAGSVLGIAVYYVV